MRKRAEVRSVEVTAEAAVIDVGDVDHGERVEIDFSDDAADRRGGDRNLYLSRFTSAS